MNNNNKNTYLLQSLVSNFEVLIDRGEIGSYNKVEFLQLINFYRSKKNIEKAIEIVDIAIEQYRYITKFYLLKSSLLLELKKPKFAFEYIDHCENISPYSVDVKILKAKAYGMLGDLENATLLLNELKTFSNLNHSAEINIIKSFLAEHTGEYDQMFDLLKEALILDPSNIEALERINLATSFTKKYEESIDFHKKLIDSSPYNHLAWFNLGQIYIVLSEYEEAIDSLEYSFLINENFEEGYLEYAEMCSQIGSHHKAVVVYEEYLQLFEADSDLYISLIKSYLELKDFNKAEEYAISSIKLDSYNDEAYFLLGEVYRNNGRWEKALNAYQTAIEIEGEREEYYGALTDMYIKLGDFKKAEKFFDIIMSMDTLEEEYYTKYIKFLISNKNFSKANEILQMSEDIVYSPDFKYLQAVICFKMNNRKEALLTLDNAMEESYEEYNLLFELAPELENDKEIMSIITYYKK